MKKVSLLEFRKNADKIIRWAEQGKHMVLTYRNKPVFRIEPIEEKNLDSQDPFYSLDSLADEKGNSLSNKEMDKIIYEK